MNRRTLSCCLLILTALLATGLGGPAAGQSPPPDDRGHRAYVANGPVQFTPADLVPLNGVVVLNTLDVVSYPVGGMFCQSPSGGTPCSLTDPGARSFCHGVTLRDGENWNATLDTYVYIGFPYDRLAPGVRCPAIAPATAGEITWWPNPESV